jgi:hypothetical protein
MTINIKGPVHYGAVMLGCDPEFFFAKDGKVIGSEKIIDRKAGLVASGNGSKIIVDGVQAEINPSPSTCRQSLASNIAVCFRSVINKIAADPSVSVSMAVAAKIQKKELDSLDEESRKFGCAPSKNVDTESENVAALVDPSKYRVRSAGGHIHLGDASGTKTSAQYRALHSPERLVPILDIIVGNTCVLLDRDDGNIERRRVYGRAGEYRTPPHGLEYRVLSNFWLRNYSLMSFVFSLSRFAVGLLSASIEAAGKDGFDYEGELLKLVDMGEIRRAINDNDYDLAWENYQKIRPYLLKVCPQGFYYPIHGQNVKEFEFFVEKGLDYWFRDDSVQHWAGLGASASRGWERFIEEVVRPQLAAEIVRRNRSAEQMARLTKSLSKAREIADKALTKRAPRKQKLFSIKRVLTIEKPRQRRSMKGRWPDVDPVEGMTIKRMREPRLAEATPASADPSRPRRRGPGPLSDWQ